MRQVIISKPGGPEVLQCVKGPDLVPASGQLLVQVKAAGVNRADLLQRQGLYPPPPGESDIPGLEIAGTITALGKHVAGWKIGQDLCSLVAGGGYASHCLVEAALAFPKPPTLTWEMAAAFPEAYLTAHETLFEKAHLRSGERVMIQAGSSGVGCAGIHLAKAAGAEVWCTTRSPHKEPWLLQQGADRVWQGGPEHGAQVEAAGGVDVVLDLVGASVFSANLQMLRPKGRMILVGLMGGRKVEMELSMMLRKQLSLKGSIMRSLELSEKIAIRNSFYARWWPLVEQGQLTPHVHQSFPLEQAGSAHEMMAAGQHSGKIVLSVEKA